MKSTLQSTAILFVLLSASPSLGQTAGAKAAQHTASAQPTPSPEKIWTELMEGNKRYVTGQPRSRMLVVLRQKLAKEQHPNVIVLTCSDSRVPPELVFDQSLGDLFVVRSAGNIADAIGLGSIEYAVEHLGSTVLVVMGHTSCGAVKAACSGEKMSTANLQAIVDKIEPAVSRVKGRAQGDGLVDAAVTENVLQSARDVLAGSDVLQHHFKDGKLTVFEAVYHLDTGKVDRMGKLSAGDASH